MYLPYEVSKEGVISNTNTGRILKQGKNKQGYSTVTLVIENKKRTFLVHRLVASYYILNLENKPQVNHLDGDKSNNNINNLEWCTGKENMQHAHTKGLVKRVFFKPQKNSKKIKCLELGIVFSTSTLAAYITGANKGQIRQCCKGRVFSANDYHFEYI